MKSKTVTVSLELTDNERTFILHSWHPHSHLPQQSLLGKVHRAVYDAVKAVPTELEVGLRYKDGCRIVEVLDIQGAVYACRIEHLNGAMTLDLRSVEMFEAEAMAGAWVEA